MRDAAAQQRPRAREPRRSAKTVCIVEVGVSPSTMATTKQATKKRAQTAKRTVKKAAKKVSKSPPVKRAKKTAKKAASRPNTRKASATKTVKRSASGPSTDAIALLKQDHREVEQLFKRFEKAGENAHRTKGQLVASMIEALSRHAAIEEMVFYPAIRREVPQAGILRARGARGASRREVAAQRARGARSRPPSASTPRRRC